MGFSTLIDLLGSMVVGGLLFIILLRLNETSTQNTFQYSGELQVQENLVSVVELLEYDFRRIGYCYDYTKIIPKDAIVAADSNSITFKTDFPTSSNKLGDGTVDVLKYYVGPSSECSSTPNLNDRKIYRVENNSTPKGVNLGVTEFKIEYFNSTGTKLTCPVANPQEIITMQISLRIENTAAYHNIYADTSHNSQYVSAFWRQMRFSSRMLDVR
jgi:hypothetical protein